MRYFCYNEYNEDDSKHVVTVSEDEIREKYYPFWYKKMCNKYGKDHIDKMYGFEDCLCDWIVINWAWAVYPPKEIDQ